MIGQERHTRTIVHATSAWAYGGAELYTADLARETLARGWRAVVVAMASEELDDWADGLARDGAEVVRFTRQDQHDGGLARRMTDFHADLAHFNSSWLTGDWKVLRALANPRTPRVMTEHLYKCFLPARPSRLGRLRTWMHRGLWVEKQRQFRQCDRIITVNQRDAELYVRNWGLPRHKVQCIHNGVDPSRFADRASARVRLASLLGASLDVPMILAVGRPEPQKGFDLLLEALAGLKRMPWRLVIAGTGENLPELRVQAGKLGLDERVDFLGHRSDVASWMAAGDVFAMPSRNEALGYSLLEAMACGVPAVASDSGGPTEVVGADEHGLLVPPCDVPALREALGRMLGDPGLRDDYSRRARRRIEQAFSRDRMLSRTFALYEDLMSRAIFSRDQRRSLSMDTEDAGPSTSASSSTGAPAGGSGQTAIAQGR